MHVARGPGGMGQAGAMSSHRDGRGPSPAALRLREAAYEAVWGCRLAAARIGFPAYVPGMEKYLGDDKRAHVWTHDWYAHVLFARRLLDAAQNLDECADVPLLTNAVAEFDRHWATLQGLRNVLQHPLNRSIDPSWLWVFPDRIEYRKPGCEMSWLFTIDELHDPVEALYGPIHDSDVRG